MNQSTQLCCKLFFIISILIACSVSANSTVDIDTILIDILSYEYGHSREALTKLSDIIHSTLNSPDELQQIEHKLIHYLYRQKQLIDFQELFDLIDF